MYKCFNILLILMAVSCASQDRQMESPGPRTIPAAEVAVLPSDGHEINVRLADAVRSSLSAETDLNPLHLQDIIHAVPSYPDMKVSLVIADSFFAGKFSPHLSPAQDAYTAEIFSALHVDYILVMGVQEVHVKPNINLPFMNDINLDIYGYLIGKNGKILKILSVTARDTAFPFSSSGPVIESMLDDAASDLADAMAGHRAEARR